MAYTPNSTLQAYEVELGGVTASCKLSSLQHAYKENKRIFFRGSYFSD